MTYTPRTLSINTREEQKRAVQSLMDWERDIFDHTNNLNRLKEMLKDENFVGSTFEGGKTFRQKAEEELSVLEWRIQECIKYIEVSDTIWLLPSNAIITEIVTEIKAEMIAQTLTRAV